MKYFRIVKPWKIIVLNAIIGELMLAPIFILIFYIAGVFYDPSFNDAVIGILIILGIADVFFFSNYIMYRIHLKRQQLDNIKETKEFKPKLKKLMKIVKLVLILAVLVLTSVLIFIWSELLLFFNGEWM